MSISINSNIEDVDFFCSSCSWVGGYLDLDLFQIFDFNLVSCPCCKDLDVRISSGPF